MAMPAGWLIAAAVGAGHLFHDRDLANRDYYMAPAHETVDVSFSCMFNCTANSFCWHYGTEGSADMNGFNRDNFIESVAAAVNYQATVMEADPAARFTLNKRTQIVIDRLVEKTSPTGANYIGTSSFTATDWNVLSRVTLLGLPTNIASNFAPVAKHLFVNSGLYGGGKAELMHPCWISTEAYFIDDRLEPYRGRGHKDQTLLIPLIAGLTFMLLVPGMVVACCVFRQQADVEKAELLREEEDVSERLLRELQEKEVIVNTKQRLEDEAQEKGRKANEDADKLRRRELDPQDCSWIEGEPEPVKAAAPPAPPPMQRRSSHIQRVEDDWATKENHGRPRWVEHEADWRVNLLAEAERDLTRIRKERLSALPIEHRVRKMLRMHVHRWRFQRIQKMVWKKDKERQKKLAKKRVGSIHFGVHKQKTEENGGVTIGKFTDAKDLPAGVEATSSGRGKLKVGDVLVYLKYDDKREGVEGEAREPEPLEDQGDLRFAVGPSKQVYEGTVLHFFYVRDDAQIKAWKETRNDPDVLKTQEALQEGQAPALAQALKVRTWKQRMKAMEKVGMPVKICNVTVGRDTNGAEFYRKKQWEKIKDCGVLNVQGLAVDKIETYLSDPDLCRQACRVRFEEADKDGSKSLDKHEIYTVFMQLAKADGLPEPSKEETRQMYKRIDVDGDGSISFEEFFPFFRRRIVQIIVGLESEMNDVENQAWQPSAFDASRESDVKEVIEGTFRQDQEMEFPLDMFNRAWKVKASRAGNKVTLFATSRHGAALHESDLEDNLSVTHEFTM